MSIALHEPRFFPGRSIGVVISGTASIAIAAATSGATRAVKSSAGIVVATGVIEPSASAVVASHATGAVNSGVVIT